MVAITHQTLKDEIRRQQALATSIAQDQAAISSTKKLLTPSQDPQAWVQVSEIARAQAQQGAWTSNVSFGDTRAAKAESNLTELNNLMTRAKELMVRASTTVLSDSDRAAVGAELSSVRASVNELLNEKDYQGTPVFDDGAPTLVPVARGINIEVVGTRQSIAEGIDVNGTPMSLDGMFAAAIAAVDSGDTTALKNSQDALDKGYDNVVLNQTLQGVRSLRLENAREQLTDTGLNLSERRSGLEDTDLSVTLTQMQAKLLSLEAAQSAFARINQQSLFDLLR